MRKWFEKEGQNEDIVVASRVRLIRNIDGEPFPVKCSEDKIQEITGKIADKISGLGNFLDKDLHLAKLGKLNGPERQALREHQLIGRSAAEGGSRAAVLASEDEAVSLLLNAEDHIRIQVSGAGLSLERIYQEADCIDDYVNERIPYAFDEQYGYMTTYPTHLGTAMQAYLVIHLPMLSGSKKFQAVVSEITRFGVAIKGAYGEGEENYGSYYVLHNQRTLGHTEEEILSILNRIGTQITSQEKKLRQLAVNSNRLKKEDEFYRAYGLLKNARILTWQEAAEALSCLRVGVSEQVIHFAKDVCLYKLMVESRDACLQAASDYNYNENDLCKARADYIRGNLPDIV